MKKLIIALMIVSGCDHHHEDPKPQPKPELTPSDKIIDFCLDKLSKCDWQLSKEYKNCMFKSEADYVECFMPRSKCEEITNTCASLLKSLKPEEEKSKHKYSSSLYR